MAVAAPEDGELLERLLDESGVGRGAAGGVALEAAAEVRRRRRGRVRGLGPEGPVQSAEGAEEGGEARDALAEA